MIPSKCQRCDGPSRISDKVQQLLGQLGAALAIHGSDCDAVVIVEIAGGPCHRIEADAPAHVTVESMCAKCAETISR